MDLGYLSVRFHFGGYFVNNGKELQYFGGSVGMASIERDLMSFSEVEGHLRDVFPDYTQDMLLHWCPPGNRLWDGLIVLRLDSHCMHMKNAIGIDDIADIFVESFSAGFFPMGEQSNGEEEVVVIDGNGLMETQQSVVQASTSQQSVFALSTQQNRSAMVSEVTGVENTTVHFEVVVDEDESDDDDESYLPIDLDASDDDAEATLLRKQFKEFKKTCNSQQAPDLDDIIYEGNNTRVRSAIPEALEDDGNETPYYSTTDNEDSFDEEDEGTELVRRKRNYPRFDGAAQVPVFAVGMRFAGKNEFKDAVKALGLAEKRSLKFIKDEKKRVRAICTWKKCPWACLLSHTTRHESWQVATYNNVHKCPPRKDNRLVTALVIANRYERMIRANPSWDMRSLRETVQEDFLATVSLSKCKRAKGIVLSRMYDATKGEYSKVFDYQLELLRSNPGSTVIVKLDPECEEPIFHRMYVCFAALKKGFMAGCRKVIGLDGCFFKGVTKGELLCAIGRDANNQMYPLAWASVEKETNDSWDWFCDLLFRDIKLGDGDGWVIISDQQKGILNAIEKWAPRSEHRMCARHIYANWKKSYKEKDWQKRFWLIAKAPCPMLFNYWKAKLALKTPEGAKAITRTDPIHWSRAYFRLGSNCDSVDNNMCESFNHWVITSRFFPIISMMETIRRQVMVRIQEQRTKSARWDGPICPNIRKKLHTYTTISGDCHPIWNGKDGYEVKHFDKRYTVNLPNKTCSCRYWQLSGLPCCHAIACIAYTGKNVEDFVADCYTVEKFNKTYDHVLEPVEGMDTWPVSPRPKPKAPGYIKMPGRPKQERTREVGEKPKQKRVSKKGTKITCSKCKGTGHNKGTCDRIHGTGRYANASSVAGETNGAGGGGSNSGADSEHQAQNMEVIQESHSMSEMVVKKRKKNDADGSIDISTQGGPVGAHGISKSNSIQLVASTRGKSIVRADPGGTASSLQSKFSSSNACSRQESGGSKRSSVEGKGKANSFDQRKRS